MQINRKVRSAWTTTLDGDDSSETHPGRDDLQSIFELDELVTQTTELSLDGTGTDRSQKPPMGRLRRIAPTAITGQQKLEFPGQFVQGFRGGHVDFNIPGILQDSLKPTDSIEVKINLFTPEVSSEIVDPFQADVIHPQNDRQHGDNDSRGFSVQTHDINHSSRFNLAWLHPETNNPQQSGLTQVSQRFGDPFETASKLAGGSVFDNMYSDSQFSYSTIDTSSNHQLHPTNHNHAPNHTRFGLDSTDSGLHSQFGHGQLEDVEHAGLSTAIFSSGAPSRFNKYQF